MKKVLKTLLIGFVIILGVLLIGPFLIPVPPLEGTVPAEELADPDSQFTELNGLRVHYKSSGQGEPALILLHGFGASLFSWQEILADLASKRLVFAYDRPAFGLTERPLEWEGENPYAPDAQADLTVRLMDQLSVQSAVLVGNSAGGTIAALTALKYPARVKALILIDPAVYTGGGAPSIVRPLLQTPQMDRLGPLIARRIQDWGTEFASSAWHDPSKISDEVWAGYTKPLQAENWDRALWELTRASGGGDLPSRLHELTLPILVITGDDDRIVPTADSIRLAGELPNAELVVIPDCGHVPHEECPAPVLQAIEAFLSVNFSEE
jgi:pimeloyl-ACP methyl ester carboxylesterase